MFNKYLKVLYVRSVEQFNQLNDSIYMHLPLSQVIKNNSNLSFNVVAYMLLHHVAWVLASSPPHYRMVVEQLCDAIPAWRLFLV